MPQNVSINSKGIIHKIINIGIEFNVVSNLESNRFEVLNNATLALIDFYTNKLEIGEPFYLARDSHAFDILSNICI